MTCNTPKAIPRMTTQDAFAKIEDIILQDDMRGMSDLKPHMKPGYVRAAAELLLNNQGLVFIVTGFHILAADAPETDGPPGAIAIGNALSALGSKVYYVTDELSADVVRSIADPSPRSHRVPDCFSLRVGGVCQPACARALTISIGCD